VHWNEYLGRDAAPMKVQACQCTWMVPVRCGRMGNPGRSSSSSPTVSTSLDASVEHELIYCARGLVVMTIIISDDDDDDDD
jgi:hypothetical protein